MKESTTNSSTYVSVWLKHFNGSKAPFSFGFVDNLSFVKHSYLPVYINVGKNLSLGISYSKPREKTNKKDFRGNVFLVYHVPSFFNVDEITDQPDLKLIKVHDAVGYLTSFENCSSIEDYLKSQMSGSRAKKIRRNIRRLESDYDISYKWYHGEMSFEEYDDIFKNFELLLKRRFKSKNEYNRHLKSENWQFYHELFYPLILEKKASFFVISANNTPIAICFNYHSPNNMIGVISVFDMDYSKYGIGNLHLLKRFEYCIENNMQEFDFRPGNFGYKHIWSNKLYDLEHHIFYDSKNLVSTLLAKSISLYFKAKIYLKQKGLKNFLVRKNKVLSSN